MNSSLPLLFAVAGSFACTPLLAATSTPEDAYDIDRTCASITAAALTQRPQQVGTDDPTDRLAVFYQQRAQSSGERAGRSPSQVSHDVDALKKDIVTRMNASDQAKAAAERADNSAMLKKCTALPVFEAEKRLSGTR